MAEEKTHHITVRLARGFEFVAEFPDTPGATPILFDEPAPIGEGRGASAAEVLGAAIGNCLAASLTFCLRRARFDVEGMTASVTTHVAKNERGRHRLQRIDVELQPTIGGKGDNLGRCGEIFEDFCIVTASVQHGIPVTVTLKDTPAVETGPAGN
jgi:uncharacterized OsmC-like protein